MFEKVNPAHVDKIADRIAGAIVDLAYSKKENPKVACEVQIGHNTCTIINETDTHITDKEVNAIVKRITFNPHLKKQLDIKVKCLEVKQDAELAKNQSKEIRCGDNGIFKGCPITSEQIELTNIAKIIYDAIQTDGKYIIDVDHITICQSWMGDIDYAYIRGFLSTMKLQIIINPLGNWTGGINVDTGATNRKLGSDMGDAVTGGGLHGKDLSKADVSINIYCHLLAQNEFSLVEAKCDIGDKNVVIIIGKGKTYERKCVVSFKEIVDEAKKYVDNLGGFEKLAEWGLIR